MKALLRLGLTVSIVLSLYYTTTYANKCTGDQIQKMINAGFSKQEITQLCDTTTDSPSKGDTSKSAFSSPLAKKIESWSGPSISHRHFTFPMFSTQDSREAQEIFTPLIHAGLLTRKDQPYEMKSYGLGGEVKSRKMVPGYRYDLTPEGQKAYFKWNDRDGGGFYAGRYELVEVVRFTEPADMSGHRVSQVTYTYRVMPDSIPNWANHPLMQQAYQPLRDLRQLQRRTDTFVLSSEGWIHESDMR